MTKTGTAALMGLTMAAFAFSGAYAQTSDAKPADKSAMTKKMSAEDMKTMKMCQAMDHDAMMKNTKCMTMMKMHPDMMKSK